MADEYFSRFSTTAPAPPRRRAADRAGAGAGSGSDRTPAATLDVPAAVERVLVAFLDQAVTSLRGLDPALAPLASAARDAVLGGGKRLRPTFAYWGWRGASGVRRASPVEPVLPALAALELLHAFALVHDDVMDRSATRRGRPTAHRTLAAVHTGAGLRGGAERFGDAGAILVGDLCLVWADELLARSGLPPGFVLAARHDYDRMRVEAIAGQFLDLLGEASATWSVEKALRTARLKTAGYTVVRPLRYGAALAGGARGSLGRAYTGYGLAVGEAFQLRDDLLGMYGEQAVTGKPVGDDAAMGKPTVLLELARCLASERQAEELERLLGPARRPDPERLAALVRETGAVARLNQMIAARVARALGALAGAPLDPEVRAALADLAEASAWRAA